MDFLTHILKKHKQTVIIISGSMLLLVILIASNSRASHGPFHPAETLDPGCAPGSPNCFVDTDPIISETDIIDGTAGSVLFVNDDEELEQNNDNFFFENDTVNDIGRLGIGTSTPGAWLHVSGNNTLTSVAQFQNPEGDVSVNLNRPAGSGAFLRFLEDSVPKWSLNADAGGSFIFRNFDLPGQTALAIEPVNNNVGIGMPDPGASLHIQGADALSTSYGLKVDNGTPTNLFTVRNDGRIGINTFPTLNSLVNITESAANGQLIILNDTNSNTLALTSYDYPIIDMDRPAVGTRFQIRISGTDELGIVSIEDDGNWNFTNNSAPESRFYISSNKTVGINNSSPTASIHSIGLTNDSTAYTLKLDDSSLVPNPLLYVRNDGNVGIGTATPGSKLSIVGLPISPVGANLTPRMVCVDDDGNLWTDLGPVFDCQVDI